MEIARLREETIHALKTPPDRGTKPKNLYNPQPLLATPGPTNKGNVVPGANSSGLSNSTPWQKPAKFIPAVVRAKKMAQGLCYCCDQPFEKGHKCGSKTTQLFLVEVPREEEGECDATNEFSGEIDFDSEDIDP